LPDRIIRDELLTSERYWSVSIEAQRLFIHLLLVVDDTARFSGKNYTIRASCFPGQAVSPDKLEKMLAELQDEDLVRLYQVGGERFIFVPRSRQRLRFRNSKYPAPPPEISDISEEKTDLSMTQVELKPDSSRQKRREEKRREENNKVASLPDWLPGTAWEEFKQHRIAIKKRMTPLAETKTLKELSKLRDEGCNPVQVLEQSIQRGWAGVFAVRKDDAASHISRGFM
jgi:hypothetical protein